MTSKPNLSEGTAGKLWLSLSAGEPPGRPMAEWAWITPRFPDGIKGSDLRGQHEQVQWETAVFWFSLNFEPFRGIEAPESQQHTELGAGKSAFALALAAGDGSVLVTEDGGAILLEDEGIAVLETGVENDLRPLSAQSVLAEEFHGVFKPAMAEIIAESLPGPWMWRPKPLSIRREENPPKLTQERLTSAVLDRLDAIETALKAAHPARGDIGHNLPPGERAFSNEEVTELRAFLAQARTAVAPQGETSSHAIQAAADNGRVIRSKLADWGIGQVGAIIAKFNEGFALEFGKQAAMWLVRLHVITLLGGAVGLLKLLKDALLH